MSKKQKIIFISVCAAILLIVAGVFLGLHITKINLTNAAVDYLCDKYNATEDEFELIDYENGNYYIDRTLFFEIKWSNYKWKYKYKDIVFNTERIDGKFYDDYQLNDLFEWTTEYLQNNVSEDIIGIEISSDMIYLHKNKFHAYINTQSDGFNQNKYWFKNEIAAFWSYQNLDTIHVYVNSMEHKEIIAKSVSRMPLEVFSVVVVFTNEDSIKRISNDTEGVVFDSICSDNYLDNEVYVYKVK